MKTKIIDKTDQKLLLALDKNPRASYAQLGRAAHISKEKAQYRVKRLIEKNIIRGFFAFIDYAQLGYQAHKILVKYKSVSKDEQGKIIDFLKKHKSVAWAGSCQGRFDLIITTITKNNEEFVKFYSTFNKKFGAGCREQELLIQIDNPVFNDKYLSEGKLLYKTHLLNYAKEEKNIDETDRAIIEEISENARTSFSEIGIKLDLNYWTISQRYKRLVREKIIARLKTRINFQKLGLEYHHIFLKLSDEEKRKEIENYYTAHPDCVMLMNHAGSYSIHLEIVSEQEHIQIVLSDLREKFGQSIDAYEALKITDEYVMNIIKGKS